MLDLIEGENMLFVSAQTRVKLPKVNALYNDPETAINYVIMEYIEGEVLTTLWPRLSPKEKKDIIASLRSSINALRALPSPRYYGSIGNRHCLDTMFWTLKENALINGPFLTETALNQAFTLKYLAECETRSPFRAEFYRQTLARLFHSHDATFPHGDFQRKNIIICSIHSDQRTTDPDCESRGALFEVALIDWEKSGWHPSYWEYSMANCAARWTDDFVNPIPEILDPFDAELPWLQMLFLDLWS
ncbi:MAG: hypothetical protein M1819_002505 [Sarea resinae]|nr:MAG: hypothetical protein M1819_002505 [Sarea resinae]